MRAPISAGLLLSLVLAGCPGPEERLVSSVQTHFDTELGGGFWSAPFPSDARRLPARRAGGSHPDYWAFPNPSDNEMLDLYITFGSTQIDGFGLNSPTYFTFDGGVFVPSWGEAEIEASGRCEGPVRIVDVDPDSPSYGSCLPARFEWIGGDTQDPYVAPNMAIVAPYWGFPLRSSTTYAVYLVDLPDADGAFLQGPEPLQQLLAGSSADAALQEVYQPLADLLSQEGWVPEEGLEWIAAATVFTTQDAVGEMQQLADRVLADPTFPAWNEDEGLTLLPPEHPEYQNQYDLYDGSYTALNFQEGTIPYASVGGGFVWDGAEPVPQVEERVPLLIGTPMQSHVQPEAGWPVLLHAHGTTGDRFSHMTGGSLRPGLMGAARGFVSVSIPQPFHGDRWPDGSGVGTSLYSFNYFNPDSGVSTFRQGALDTIALARFVAENMAEGGPIAEAHPELRIDPDSMYFIGHSQGGLTGAIALPFTEGIRGWVLSGTGGGLSMTMMQREDPLVIRDALLTGLGAPAETQLFAMHPLVGMIQAFAERTDPINYAPLWVDESVGEPVSILLTEGLHDAQTPADTAEALAVAAGLPIVRPYREREIFGLSLRGLDSIREPYSANATHPDGTSVTTGLAQFDSNHFAIFNEGDAALLWANFLYSQVRDGPPGELGASFP